MCLCVSVVYMERSHSIKILNFRGIRCTAENVFNYVFAVRENISIENGVLLNLKNDSKLVQQNVVNEVDAICIGQRK